MAAKRRNRNSHKRERRFTVRSIRRDPPDIRKLSKALIALAMAEAEREAQAEAEQAAHTRKPQEASVRTQTGGGPDD